jgi:hypothetical protein
MFLHVYARCPKWVTWTPSLTFCLGDGLVKQELYHWSQPSSYLCHPCIWEDSCVPPHLAY